MVRRDRIETTIRPLAANSSVETRGLHAIHVHKGYHFSRENTGEKEGEGEEENRRELTARMLTKRETFGVRPTI